MLILILNEKLYIIKMCNFDYFKVTNFSKN